MRCLLNPAPNPTPLLARYPAALMPKNAEVALANPRTYPPNAGSILLFAARLPLPNRSVGQRQTKLARIV